MTEEELGWITTEFNRCRPFIQAALDRDLGTHDIEDVRVLVESGVAQIWPTKNAAMISVVETYPKAKVLRGWLSGGDLTEIQQSEPVIRKWAEGQGCDLVLIGGRKGWLRAFDGYREACTVMFRKLK